MVSKLLLCLLLGAVNAAPQGYGAPANPSPSYNAPGGGGGPSGPVVPILVDVREGPDAAGVYNFNFETGDGISRHEQGAPQGPEGAVAAQGGWSFTFPDGTPGVFNFVADGSGYRVESDLLPTPHPLPAHAIAQIEFAAQQAAAEAAGGARPQYSAPPPAPSQGYSF
ncbi:cuticle protein AM1239-like [Macrobrachium nipponense]|uniref:cuticle protein AM1239-like n=1 Tax=Macrobrachium nipponense TaxID=159736 RepID=UPI0030C7B8BD